MSSPSAPPKRLLFDRRYGWVFDEWKEPSEEALSGGRGMFCIVPLAKAIVVKASESMNFVASSTLNALRSSGAISPPKVVEAAFHAETHKIALSQSTTDDERVGVGSVAVATSSAEEEKRV